MALSDNLVAYYKLDESSGDASDSSGNGYTLTNTNTVGYATALINNGADFGTANTNKVLTRASNLGITNGACSISIWVKLRTEIASGTYGFIQKSNATNHVAYIISYEYNGGTRRLAFNRQRQNTSNNYVNYTTTLGTSNWNHLVLTYDGTTLTGYLNGVSVGTPLNTSGDGASGGDNTVDIGHANEQFSTSYSSMYADEVGIWSRALSASEVTSLYNSGAGLAYPFTTARFVPKIAIY
jgi:hypothetical protein